MYTEAPEDLTIHVGITDLVDGVEIIEPITSGEGRKQQNSS